MVLESEPVLFYEWIGPALAFFLQAAAILGLISLVVGYLVAAFRYGPLEGGDLVFRKVTRGLGDLISISPRRVLALAWLAIQESLRRRVLVGFAVFLLILLFAGWFLDTASNDPATLYLSFVLTATTYLVLMMALLLSVFSLPADVKNKTIHTVVTKPVRPGEIVLGRIIGFSLIGTMLLAVMGVFSYFFVVRVLDHTHEVEITSLEQVAGGPDGQRSGRTTLVQNHRHQVTIDAEGRGSTDVVNGHWHTVDPSTDAEGNVTYVLGPPQDLFAARVPAYGQLRFRDRAGKGVSRGVNVGNEWGYRSFIEGATLASAIFTFDNVTTQRFPNDTLPIEMIVRVFRSHKGDVEEGIRGTLVLRNPRNRGVQSGVNLFTAKDGVVAPMNIERKLTNPAGETIDLFDDLAPDGELEIELQCLDGGQYFGVGKGDMYLRARDAWFTGNFVKGYIGIWVQMLLVTSFGVMFSTFLSGPVAMMATIATFVFGLYSGFIMGVAQGDVEGGGPVEAFVRIIQQRNVTTAMEPGLTTDVVQAADKVFMSVMTSVTALLPEFPRFDNVEYVAHGFDVPPDVILVQFFTGLAYVAAVFAIGYFLFRMREVAR